jgi:hypothetical protein
MPNAFVYRKEYLVKDYIYKSGGLSDNANIDKIVIKHPNGNATIGDINSSVNPGDKIMVLPKIDEKEFLFAKELVGVLYQVAIGANILLP